MAYQQSKYSDLDWLTAVLMGEAGPRDNAAGMGALADVVMNRVNGTQAPSSAYGNQFTYAPNTVAGQVSAYQGESPQFSSYDRNQSLKEGGGSASANQALMTALTQGASGFSGASLAKYNQAREVANSFLTQGDPNYGRYSGSSGGADFFVAHDFPTYLRSGGRYGSQTIGGSDFFKLKSNGDFTPYTDPGDRGLTTALPLAGSDGVGDGYNVSTGAGNGNIGSSPNGGPYETGDHFGFGGTDVSQGGGTVGNGNLIGGLIPYGKVDPRSFAGQFAVGDALSAGDGSLGNSGGAVETGDPHGFSTGDILQSFYRNALGRDADAAGLDNWKGQIHPGGMSLGQALDGIASTPEARARQSQTGIDPRAYAIADTYASTLHRLPDQQGLTSWMSDLSKGASLDSVLGRIAGSSEGQQAQLTDFYHSAFGRAPDQAGLNSALSQVQAGRSLQAVEADMLASPEAQARGVTRDQIASMLTPSYFAQPEGPGTTTGTLGFGGITTTGEKTGTEVGTLGAGTTTGTLNTGTEVGTLGSGTTTTGEKSGTEVGMQGPTSGETTTAWNGRFDPNAYKAANADVAASGMDPLTHYLTYGFKEGRALDTQGDHINQGFDPSKYLAANPDVAADHQDPLAHYLRSGAAEGRALPTGDNPYSFSNYNVAQGAGATGNGSFNGHFDPSAYLAANADVKASGMDPLTHYLTYGFKEGRALDQAGDRINQGFDPSKYLAANPDVAQAGMDPLKHYLLNGASEGRALPTGSNPYSFSNFNVAQGAGATGNGSFGLGGITSTGGTGSSGGNPGLPDMGGGFNVSGGVQNGGFGLGGITSGSSGSSGGGISDPYGFSGANVGGGLGATSQSMGGFYPAGGGQGAGGGGIDPYGFSSANVSGFNANGGGGGAAKTTSDPNDWGSGEGLGETTWATDDGSGGFNAQASEMSFLRGQLADQAAKDARSASSGDAGKALVALGATQNAQLDATGAANAARQFAGIQGGLGITPVTGTTLFTPTPVIRVGSMAGGPMLGFF